MLLDKKLVEIVACPICKGKLIYQQELSRFVCRADRLGFPVENGIPVLIEMHATHIDLEDLPK